MAVEIRVFLAVDAFFQQSGTALASAGVLVAGSNLFATIPYQALIVRAAPQTLSLTLRWRCKSSKTFCA